MTSVLAHSLAGVRVLDVSRVLAGPYAGQILADLGADVVKVEQPGSGDETRSWGPPFSGDLSAYFLCCNRGKRSIALDLKNRDDRSVFDQLVRKADVVLENFRADSLEELGMGVSTLHQLNPRLVICSLSGFGRSGAWAERPGYDFVVQGMSGMMAATGPKDGEPYKFGVAIADIVTGQYAAIAVLAALRSRAASGEGCAVELALIDCAVATMANVGQSYLVTGNAPMRQGNAHAQIAPYQTFATQDGWIILAIGNDQQWQRFCNAVDRPDLAKDQRFLTNQGRVQLRDVLVPLVANVIATRTTADWIRELQEVQVPCGPIWDLPTLIKSDLATQRRFVVKARRPDGSEVELLRSPLVPDPPLLRSPPDLGGDRATVLAEWLG